MAITEAEKRATVKYIAGHYDQICVKVKKGSRDRIRNHATKCGQSMNEYISSLIYEDVDKAERPQYAPEVYMYLPFIRKLICNEELWEPIGNALSKCLKDGEITEDDYRTIIFASGVDRNKFDAKMKVAGIKLPITHHIIR